jgi:hydroxyacylglutathione hydrolase
MKAWQVAGLPLARLEQLPVGELFELHKSNTGPTILDVRSPQEWEAGHIPGAEHLLVAEMRGRIRGLDKEQHYATYCASGYRASIASSLMQARGFKRVSRDHSSAAAARRAIWCNMPRKITTCSG